MFLAWFATCAQAAGYPRHPDGWINWEAVAAATNRHATPDADDTPPPGGGDVEVEDVNALPDLLDERDRMLATIARVEALAKRWDTGLWPTDDGGTIHSRHQSHGNGPQGDEQVGLALGDTRGADRPSDRRIR